MTVMPWKLFSNLTQASEHKSADKSPHSAARPTVFTIGIGSVIQQRYRLDAELGRGGIGIVYRAHDIPNDRAVALKVLNVEALNAPVREQFLQEARITSRLNHPNMVRVYETGTVDADAESFPFIVMQYVPGKNLGELRGLTCARIVELGRQICAALEYIHGQGFVHRDLKPQNVLVERQGFRYVAKLADLGLARPRGMPNLPTEGIAGTVYYVAPEVIAGQPADVAADLYALGAMLYEMVTGRVPFSDYDEQSILSQHLNESVVPPSQSRPDVPPALEAIILRLLAKNPQDRFASARKVCDALSQVAEGLEHNGARNNNLPQVSTAVVGRENEIAQVKRLLESSRLVTVLGTPGAGKTLLALATGAELTSEFLDGVWLVELESCPDPALVPQAVASVLGVREEPTRSLVVSLTEYLREKSLLILLDHCDALVGACAQFAETILRVCPEVHILATSRERLNISDEQVYAVHE